jgi:hypothetical protein
MRIIRWAILLILAGATIVFLGTAVYAYQITGKPNNFPHLSTLPGTTGEQNPAIDLVMEEEGLALVTAALLLAEDWRRGTFPVENLRLSRVTGTARFLPPEYELQSTLTLERPLPELPGPLSAKGRPAMVSSLKVTTPCSPPALSNRLLWPRPWPTTPNPATIPLCPDEEDRPLLANTP